jgi:hypothetical protein
MIDHPRPGAAPPWGEAQRQRDRVFERPFGQWGGVYALTHNAHRIYRLLGACIIAILFAALGVQYGLDDRVLQAIGISKSLLIWALLIGGALIALARITLLVANRCHKECEVQPAPRRQNSKGVVRLFYWGMLLVYAVLAMLLLALIATDFILGRGFSFIIFVALVAFCFGVASCYGSLQRSK